MTIQIDAATVAASQTGGRGFATALRASPAAMIGVAIVAAWAIAALLAPWIAPYPPNQNDLAALADPTPSAAHWLGTDQMGRDLLSRLLWGARTVLAVAPLAVLAAAVLGTALGLWAGYRRGVVDAVLSRICDVILSFPVIILYMLILAKFGSSAINIILVIGVTKAPIIFRIIRGVTLELSQREYVAAARMNGESTLYVMFAEILPNARGPLLIDICLRLGYTTVAIGVLGFLGIGLPPPDPDWGGMVKESYGLITVWPHMALFPCLAISSLVIGFNLIAAGLKEGATNG